MLEGRSNHRPLIVNSAVRFVALLEALKGLLALLAATGLLSLVHKDLHALTLRLVEHAHLNPAARYPEIFLTAASNLQNSRLVFLALGSATYSVLRFIEAYGLLRGRAWAELLAAASGAVYLPFEFLEFVHHPSALHAVLLAGNLAIVLVMVGALVRRRLRDGSVGYPPASSHRRADRSRR